MQDIEQIKENKAYNHPNFLISDSKNQKLVMEISGSFLKLIISDLKNTILYLQEIVLDSNIGSSKAIELASILLKKNDVLYSNFSSVLVLFHTPIFTLVPNEFYNQAEKNDWIRFNYGENEMLIAETCEVKNNEATLIYKSNPEWKIFCTRNFLKVKTKHVLASFVDYQLQKTKNVSNASIWILGCLDYLYITVCRNGTLQFVNAFELNSPEDFLYSIMLVFETLGIDINNEIIYFGEVNFELECMELAKKYIPKFSLGIFPEEISCELYIKKHHYQSLFSGLICE